MSIGSAGRLQGLVAWQRAQASETGVVLMLHISGLGRGMWQDVVLTLGYGKFLPGEIVLGRLTVLRLVAVVLYGHRVDAG